MNYEELDELLGLQRQAYGCLLWIKQLMRGNVILLADLKAGRFADAGFCREWVIKNLKRLPSELRPDESRFQAFARLLGSFFQTSFRVGVRRFPDEVRVTLNAGLKSQTGRKHRARMLARTVEPVAAWHPLDSTDPSFIVGPWCLACPFISRCEKHR